MKEFFETLVTYPKTSIALGLLIIVIVHLIGYYFGKNND